jgi:hypothetical protein
LDSASVSTTAERGLRCVLVVLDLLLRAKMRESRDGWYISIGVGAMLFGVSGKSLSMNLVADMI